MQADARHPQRVLVAHPFNPVYLLPLVEIVGGDATTTEARKAAESFYRGIGMHPLQVRKEVDAFLADRMMEALWREALHLVREGAATADELDQAICYGPGLRWSFMGSFLTTASPAAKAASATSWSNSAPASNGRGQGLTAPTSPKNSWTPCPNNPTPKPKGRTIADLERIRDDCLVSVMQALRANDWASGKVWKQHEEVLYEKSHRRTLEEDTAVGDVPSPLTLHQGTVPPEWVDYNNHMTESRYLQAFGDASDAPVPLHRHRPRLPRLRPQLLHRGNPPQLPERTPRRPTLHHRHPTPRHRPQTHPPLPHPPRRIRRPPSHHRATPPPRKHQNQPRLPGRRKNPRSPAANSGRSPIPPKAGTSGASGLGEESVGEGCRMTAESFYAGAERVMSKFLGLTGSQKLCRRTYSRKVQRVVGQGGAAAMLDAMYKVMTSKPGLNLEASQENWLMKRKVDGKCKGGETCLEKSVAMLAKNGHMPGWYNQVPTASGVTDSFQDRKPVLISRIGTQVAACSVSSN